MKIQIESYVNGYSLVIYNDQDGFIVREVADTKLEILNTMLGVITKLALDEKKLLEAAL
jgi:hypothetical protein